MNGTADNRVACRNFVLDDICSEFAHCADLDWKLERWTTLGGKVEPPRERVER